jgi:mRNA-degrading endonuclease RelE of RelBE toxin-antitoxin system
MPFQIEFSPTARIHLSALRKFDQGRVLNAIEAQLKDAPLVPTRNRKPMRSNLIATWELRIGNFQVYYDVNEAGGAVLVRAVGVKHHGRVSIGGQEIDLK